MENVIQKTTLVVGASGATGSLLVEQLLKRNQKVKIIVRSLEKLTSSIQNNKNVIVIQGSVLDFDDESLAAHVKDCTAVASCLGHNLTWKGIFGHPRRLVTDAVIRLCNAVKENKAESPVKFVLMNTAGNSNRDLTEAISFSQRCVVWLIRHLLPPHADNEKAADYLRLRIAHKTQVVQDSRESQDAVEWVVVRPDSLIDKDSVSAYELHASPTRSAIFNAGKSSRINVGSFMADLISDNTLWDQWKGQMPVNYNKE